jgi:UPF0755 protein
VRRLLLVGLFLLASAYGLWVVETRRPVRRAQDPPQTLIVEEGWGVREIGNELGRAGLVRHPAIFRALAVLRGDTRRLRAGEYALEGSLSLEQVLEKLARGEVVHRRIIFPEGADIEEMAEIAGRQGIHRPLFLAAVGDASAIRDLDPQASDLEGYLFPDSYELTRSPDAARRLVQRMVQRFRAVLAAEQKPPTERRFSVRELVTLASIVEKETGLAEERPRIAAVFLNRLERRMPLQTDPTVIFALKKAGTYDGNLRRSDLEIDSPYNTYRHAGLPPGPIASPGAESLRAVLQPAVSRELYFVSRNDGSHQFSENLAEHERAVTRYQRTRHGGE